MKLYGMLASPYVARVVLFARLKGLDLTPQSPPGGNIKSAEFLALSPIGKMPVLDVDGVGLPESEIICEYLEDAYPARPVIPSQPLDAARARLLARFYDLYVYPQVAALYKHVNPSTRDATAVAAATDALNKAFGYIEHFMGSGPFAVGAAPSLAECALLPGLANIRQSVVPTFGLADPTQGNSKLGRWWTVCGNHEVCGPFMRDYAQAIAAFMKSVAAARK
jgi:glutathione S-transferase